MQLPNKDDLQVIIPMAGLGRRFLDRGYKLSKPLIPVGTKPMIQRVVENLGINKNFTFLIQNELLKDNTLNNLLDSLCYNPRIISLDKLTEGPLSTVLLAREYISDSPLLVINCDQIIGDFSIDTLLNFVKSSNSDGVLGTFISNSPKNSYVRLNNEGTVELVREKEVISNIATNGLHFWRNGHDFLRSADKTIEDNIRCNGEFYIAPTYNYLIQENKKIHPFFYNLHWPIGTPEDLEFYIENIL